MEFRFKYEWTVADVQKFINALKKIYLESIEEIIPEWKQIMQDLYAQIINSYYKYNPTMYHRIGGGGHLLSAYKCNIIKDGLDYENKFDTDEFITDSHWSITGSDNFSEEGIMNHILSGKRSLPPWVKDTEMPLTYVASVNLSAVGYSGEGKPREVWDAADDKIGEYLTDKIIKLMEDKMIAEFYESIGDYIE